ncbi:hypothetical protein K2X05_03525 [bacterium]|nr:hypothetical protein [bacterium]
MGLISVTAWATPSAQLYLNPYYPQYAQQEQIELLDSSLQNDFRQFAERRERTQKIWTEYAPVETRLVEKDSFVLKRIMDRSTARLLKSDYFRRSRLGKTANSVKDKMETDMEFKDEKNITHHFDFKLALFQGQAFIQYSGYTKAQLRYDVSQQQLAVVFQHDLSPSSSIGIESSLMGANQVQMVNLNYVW